MDIIVEELKERMDSGTAPLVIDVREEYEYDEFNIGVKNIPMGEIVAKLPELEAHKNDEIVVHCRSGVRSANIQAFLKQQGFTNVRNLTGGMLEWQEKFPG